MAAVRATIPQLTWNRVRPAPVVLVTGPQEFLADRAYRDVKTVLKTEDPSLEVTEIGADTYLPGELFGVASPSLFGEPRLIRVSQVEKCTDAFLADTLSYLEAPADDTYLVLRHASGQRGKKLLDAIRAGLGNGIEIACLDLKRDVEKSEFAAAEFAAAGRRVTGGAVRALVSAFAGDLAELASACQQLLADDSDEITEMTVERYYSGRIETNAFAVADAAIAGKRGDALVLLRHALATGADPVPIVAAFAAKLRTMARVSGSRGSSGQAAAAMGLAPWQVDRARRDLLGWTEQGLAEAIEAIAQTDAGIKSGARDQVYAIERMVGVIATRGS